MFNVRQFKNKYFNCLNCKDNDNKTINYKFINIIITIIIINIITITIILYYYLLQKVEKI